MEKNFSSLRIQGMSGESECVVTSEILPFLVQDSTAKPLLNEKNVVSKVSFSIPGKTVGVEKKPLKDEDGDYIVERRSCQTLILEHSISTEIKHVGLQVWRAALLLADFVLHFQDTFREKTVLELGSGVGLTGAVIAMVAKKVICTDIDSGNILTLLRSNLERNLKLFVGEPVVEELNFFNTDWSETLNEKMNAVEIVLAADVIYDNDITEAFVRTIAKILSCPPKKTLYIGLEKRYVFTISDLNSVAPCFEHFKSCFESEREKHQWRVTELSIDFPQYFSYERTKELVLFEVTTV